MNQTEKDYLEIYTDTLLEQYKFNLKDFIADILSGEEIEPNRLQMLGMLGHIVASNRHILYFLGHKEEVEKAAANNQIQERIAKALESIVIAS